MPSKLQKGNAFQLWVCKYLQARGWSVYNQTPVTLMLLIKGKRIFVKMHKDIFGSDLIAVKHDERILFIQATLDGHVEKREVEFNRYDFPRSACVQLWYKRPDGVIEIKTMDERKLVTLAYIQRGHYTPVNDWLQHAAGNPNFGAAPKAPAKKCEAVSSDASLPLPQSS